MRVTPVLFFGTVPRVLWRPVKDARLDGPRRERLDSHRRHHLRMPMDGLPCYANGSCPRSLSYDKEPFMSYRFRQLMLVAAVLVPALSLAQAPAALGAAEPV